MTKEVRMDEHCVIFITAGSKEEAEKLSRGMIEKKLAFCVNTVPGIQSTTTGKVSFMSMMRFY